MRLPSLYCPNFTLDKAKAQRVLSGAIEAQVERLEFHIS